MSRFRDLALKEMGLTPLWVPRQAAAAHPEVSHAMRNLAELPPVPAALVAAPLAQARQPVEHLPPHLLTHDALRDAVAACTQCGLCDSRRQTVFGNGPLSVPWMFVGDGPGEGDEDEGRPFTGVPGRLLDNMLAELDLRRGRDVYVSNAVKCRTPGTGRPEASSVLACRDWLMREIALVQPRLIVALGAVAAQLLLDTDAPVGSLRGQVHRRVFDGRAVEIVVTWHPAYVLRKLSEKARSWDDLCLARELLSGTSADQTLPV